MPKKIESTRNTYDNPSTPIEVALNSSTYTDLLSPNPSRIGYTVSNESPFDVYIKEKRSTDPDDNNKRGFWLPKRSVYESPPGDVPVGYVSAMSGAGTPNVLVEEH